MRRDSIALIVVLVVVGLVFWAARRVADRSPATAGTNFLFAMDSSGAGGYSFQVTGAADGSSDWVAFLDRKSDSGHLTASQYEAFLRGFARAGGQGLQWLADLGSPNLTAELSDPEVAVIARTPAVVVSGTMLPAGDTDNRAEYRRVAKPYMEPRQPRPLATPADVLSTVEPVPGNYWYDITNPARGEHAHFVLHPFDSDGRRLLAYLKDTLVFTSYQQLVRQPLPNQ